ncbi:uncharacterized protein LOC143247304 isoform X6 [Tachypleus tridentatus]|uniref:uncharacterized protein LOC143247304 isoform X6 n=1 Tax=Tachypleus tridentatus TaxID=6853 RepID=UPI003FD3B539
MDYSSLSFRPGLLSEVCWNLDIEPRNSIGRCCFGLFTQPCFYQYKSQNFVSEKKKSDSDEKITDKHVHEYGKANIQRSLCDIIEYFKDRRIRGEPSDPICSS